MSKPQAIVAIAKRLKLNKRAAVAVFNRTINSMLKKMRSGQSAAFASVARIAK